MLPDSIRYRARPGRKAVRAWLLPPRPKAAKASPPQSRESPTQKKTPCQDRESRSACATRGMQMNPTLGANSCTATGLAPVPWIDEAGQGGHGRRKIEARKESEGEEYGTGHVQAVGQRHEQKGQSGKDQGKGRHAARKHPAEEKTAHELGDAEAQALHEQERSGGRVTRSPDPVRR